jgi:hypothetical protein
MLSALRDYRTLTTARNFYLPMHVSGEGCATAPSRFLLLTQWAIAPGRCAYTPQPKIGRKWHLSANRGEVMIYDTNLHY